MIHDDHDDHVVFVIIIIYVSHCRRHDGFYQSPDDSVVYALPADGRI